MLPTIAFALTRGLSPHAIEEAIGQSIASLNTWDERVADEVLPALWSFMSHTLESADRPLTLAMAAEAPLGFLGDVGTLARHAADAEQALSIFARNEDLISDRASINMETSASFVALRAWHPYDALDSGRTLEACAAMVNRFLGHHFGPEMRPAEVRFGIERNGSRAAYAEFFGAPVQFEAEESGVALVFKRSALKAENRSPSPIAAHLFESYMAEVRRQRRRDHDPAELQRLRRVIAAMLRERRAPTAPEIAKRAGLSLRSAQRLAARYGVTLRELVEEGRIERARVLLIASPALSVDEVARQLGYAEPSGFRRAFRRWSGESIGDLRRRLR
ncbi:MAG: AraC family transcriptional regulator ligand-binding domain-containing protein [Pseudomonadota bacterium]